MHELELSIQAGGAAATVTLSLASTPSAVASSIVSFTRIGASGCCGPKSYPASRSSQDTCSVQSMTYEPATRARSRG